jgi:hypothetical protein
MASQAVRKPLAKVQGGRVLVKPPTTPKPQQYQRSPYGALSHPKNNLQHIYLLRTTSEQRPER